MKSTIITKLGPSTPSRPEIYLLLIILAGSFFAILNSYSELFLYGPDMRYVYMQLSIAVILMFVFPLIHFLKQRDVLEPANLFMTLYGLFYCLKFVDILINGPTRTDANTGPLITSKAIFLANTAICSFYIGYLVPASKSPRKTPKEGLFVFKWNRTSIRIVSSILIIVGLLAITSIMYKKIFSEHTLRMRGLWMRGMGGSIMLSFFYPAGIMIRTVGAIARKTKITDKAKSVFRCVLLLAPLLLLGSRGHFFVFFMASIIIFHYRVRKINIKSMIIITFIFLIFCVGYVNQRGSGDLHDIFAIKKIFPSFNSFSNRVLHNFQGTDGFIMVLDSDIPKTYGAHYLSVFTVYIPKNIWPDKPRTGSELYFTNYFYPGIHATGSTYGASLLGAFYMSFGYWEMITGMFLLGLTLKLLYRWFLNYNSFKSVQVIYAVLVPIICLKSTIQGCPSMIAYIPMVLTPVLIGILLMNLLQQAVKPGRNDPAERHGQEN